MSKITSHVADSTSASSTPSFGVIQPDTGTSPTADQANDTLTITSPDGSILVHGESSTDTIQLTAFPRVSRVAISASYTIGITNQLIAVTALGTSIGITLPSGASCINRVFEVKDETNSFSVFNTRIYPPAGMFIEGSSFFTGNIDGEAIRFYATGVTNFFIL